MENILRDCAERLISAANAINSASTTAGQLPLTVSTTSASLATSSEPSTTRSTSTISASGCNGDADSGPSTSSCQTSAAAAAAVDEHRRIFGYRPSRASARLPIRPPARRIGRGRIRGTPYPGASSSKSKSKNTFTRAFVCLSNMNQTLPPNAAEKISLSLAGLGEEKITFNKDGESQHVHEKILETFPAMGNCGGYEILRISDGNSRQLIDVPCPPAGYTVNFFKNALGQAKAFLRPLQQDIPLNIEQPKVKGILRNPDSDSKPYKYRNS